MTPPILGGEDEPLGKYRQRACRFCGHRWKTAIRYVSHCPLCRMYWEGTLTAISQEIIGDGTYRLLQTIRYYSRRYDKWITAHEGMISDGATGAMDITSIGWWIHDVACERGTWDDGTPITNWQASQVLQDILTSEGRKWQGHRWFWATLIFGGGKARDNGMF